MVMISAWCVYPGCLLGNVGSLCEYDEVVWPIKVGTWWEATRSSGTLPAEEISTLIQFILRKELILRKSTPSLCSAFQSHSGNAFSSWTHTAPCNTGSNQKLNKQVGTPNFGQFSKKNVFKQNSFLCTFLIPRNTAILI